MWYADVSVKKRRLSDPNTFSGVVLANAPRACRYLEYNYDGHFEAATGTLRLENTDGLLDFRAHIWVEDAPDGGASEFIKSIHGRTLDQYVQEPGQSDLVSPNWRSKVQATASDSTRIYAHCHCKGVEFWISPPDARSKEAESPWPDLLVPSESGSSTNTKNHPWWLPTPNHFLAGTCACRSCARASGFDITFWAFVPTNNITLDPEGKIPFTRSPYWASFQTFRSRDDVTRTFCGRCGANIFYEVHSRPSIVDVAVGLLDTGSGARAEEVLAWWSDRVSFKEYALNRGLIAGLEDGLRAWGEKCKGHAFVAPSSVLDAFEGSK